ncbi:ribonuclease P protein subunit p40-like [Galleria mellonella]|uniref:Ribonuclease P protein subunit p40-like n=1 Tax=Galleria mellonella TaxID=7137 RepID=A0A6J1WQC5_GALME|nr:ribonuclease P protein subunit p40-like [Galleria mellonella]
MLCPEVWNFPPPKVMTYQKRSESIDSIIKTVKMNHFYKSLVVTLPDNLQVPAYIEESLTEDTDYYKISNCPLTEFLEPVFIDSFVKNGKLHCLSTDRNCITQNCFAITPDGVLTLHIIEFIYQTLGLEGTKRPHNFYEIRIDLKNMKNFIRIKSALNKLETFNFILSWEPNSEDICPSSIAKYFNDRNIQVSVSSVQVETLTPPVTEIPSLKDVELEDMVEWIGMLAHNVDLTDVPSYISTYDQPDSEYALKSTRISVSIVKGMLTPNIIENTCKHIEKYVFSRDLDNYWSSLSIQSYEDSLWQWNTSSPAMFQAHDSSCNIFITNSGENLIYSIGQLKYS